jgi:hypothetical protein
VSDWNQIVALFATLDVEHRQEIARLIRVGEQARDPVTAWFVTMRFGRATGWLVAEFIAVAVLGIGGLVAGIAVLLVAGAATWISLSPLVFLLVPLFLMLVRGLRWGRAHRLNKLVAAAPEGWEARGEPPSN